MDLTMNPNIEEADTLPGKVYSSKYMFEEAKEKIFAKSWQYVCTSDKFRLPASVYPFSFMDTFIDEPLIFVRDKEDQVHCLSNVCTHRGNLMVESPCQKRELVCCYHGRRFGLDGKFKSMPEFKEVKNFPSERDNLHSLSFDQLGDLMFTSLDPAFNFEEAFGEIKERLSFLPLNEMLINETLAHDYLVKANWGLYVENYLEGFHIPFVHPGLAKAIDFGSYKYEIGRYHNLQIGIMKGGEMTFDIPEGHKDHGQDIGAYYYWVFPNLMLNFYPWGLSLNVVKPIQRGLTKVSFIPFVWDESKMEGGAGGDLDTVQREDEAIVEMVQKGVGSRFYKKGRYSATMEKGVHHFHSLLSEFLTR